MLKTMFAISRRLHLYLGVLLAPYLVLMGVTGILLNHPNLIAGLEAPAWLTPPSFRVEEWNRGALRTMVFSRHDPAMGFLAGSEGVWRTTDGGVSFQALRDGFPGSPYHRRTDTVLLLEDDDSLPPRLLAATRGGLFHCFLPQGEWQPVPLGEGNRRVVKVLAVGERLLAFTDSRIYEAGMPAAGQPFDFAPIDMPTRENPADESISLLRLIFALHSGSIWGLPGRLLVDAATVALLFLAGSAVYLWYRPRSRRRSNANVQTAPGRALSTPGPGRRAAGTHRTGAALFSRLYRLHHGIGLWVMPLLVVVAATSLFMPPSPLVAKVRQIAIPQQYWPGPLPADPWQGNIANAAYDSAAEQILLEIRGGRGRALWSMPIDLVGPVTRIRTRIPMSAMGSSVLETTADGYLLVGSLSGLYQRDLNGGRPAVDLLAVPPGVARRTPGPWRIAGFFTTPAGERFAVSHDLGIIGLEGAISSGRFQVPEEMVQGQRLPLWSFLFSVHNGRIFRDWIDNYYLIPFLGALGLLLLTLTGTYDRLWRARKKRKR